MNTLELYKTLGKHRALAEKRRGDFEKNNAAKWIMYIFTAFIVVYLIIFSILMALGSAKSRTTSPIEYVCCVMPLVFALDFSCRFTLQQTPSQMIKPYVLLPVPKYACVDFFIINRLFKAHNLFWFVLLVPYCLMAVLFNLGIWKCIEVLFLFWLFELCISQFYLIVRTLINDTLLWWLLPVCIVVCLLLPGADFSKTEYITSNFSKFYNLADFFLFYGKMGAGIGENRIWPFLLMGALLVVLLYINRRVQYSHVMSELSRMEKSFGVTGTSRIGFLDKFGDTGMFLALEIKTIARNKNPRKSFVMAVCSVVLFSLLIIFTGIYDMPFMTVFLCLYNYTMFGAITLVKIMCIEGNYIDGLMVRRENIFHILCAKYLFNCILLLLPFCLMIPVVVSGKWSLLMIVSYALFTSGFQFFLLFQLAAGNRTTQPLNTKFISNGIDNSKWQITTEMICLFVPAIFVSFLHTFFGDISACLVMLFIGLVFTASHRLWLRNVYNRFMRNRYVNMEGFRASR